MSKAIQNPKLHPKKFDTRHTPLAADQPGSIVLTSGKLKLSDNAVTPPQADSGSPTRNSKGIDDMPLDCNANSRKGETKTKTTSNPASNQETSDPLNWAKKGTAKAAPAPSSIYSPKNYLYKIGAQKKNWTLFQTLNCSTKDCFLCSKKKGLRSVIKTNLEKKYLTSRESYNVKVINDIIYNENTHLVSMFKDYLIYDDVSEFLKRVYVDQESSTRLPKVFDFYNKYSKVFPNYVNIEEKKFMFKNIERKQRLIDEQQKCMAETRKKKTPLALTNSEIDDKVFTTHFIGELNKPDSILGKTLRDEESVSTTQIQNYKKNQAAISGGKKATAKGVEHTNLDEASLHHLVEKFIMKDSQSVIDTSSVIRPGITPPSNIGNKKQPPEPPIKPMKKVPELSKSEPRHNRMSSVGATGSTRNVMPKSPVDSKPAPNRLQSTKSKQDETPKQRITRTPSENVQSRNTKGVGDVFTSPKRAAGTSTANRATGTGLEKYSAKTLAVEEISRTKSQGKLGKCNTQLSEKPSRNASSKPKLSTRANSRPGSSLGVHPKTSNNDVQPQRRNLTRQASLLNGKSTVGAASTKTISHTPKLSQGSNFLLGSRKEAVTSPRKGTLDKKELITQKKVLAIDIEALNKNLQKQKFALDSRMLRTAKAEPRSQDHCSNRTPDPGRKQFKSDYLNSIKQKIEDRLNIMEEETREKQIQAKTNAHSKQAVASMLASSKSVSNCRKAKVERASELQAVYQTKAFPGMSNKRLDNYRSPHVI